MAKDMIRNARKIAAVNRNNKRAVNSLNNSEDAKTRKEIDKLKTENSRARADIKRRRVDSLKEKRADYEKNRGIGSFVHDKIGENVKGIGRSMTAYGTKNNGLIADTSRTLGRVAVKHPHAVGYTAAGLGAAGTAGAGLIGYKALKGNK